MIAGKMALFGKFVLSEKSPGKTSAIDVAMISIENIIAGKKEKKLKRKWTNNQKLEAGKVLSIVGTDEKMK